MWLKIHVNNLFICYTVNYFLSLMTQARTHQWIYIVITSKRETNNNSYLRTQKLTLWSSPREIERPRRNSIWITETKTVSAIKKPKWEFLVQTLTINKMEIVWASGKHGWVGEIINRDLSERTWSGLRNLDRWSCLKWTVQLQSESSIGSQEKVRTCNKFLQS